MSNFIISEESIHYAIHFLERYADKAPHKEHEKASKEMRKLSDYLIDNLYTPIQINVVRHPKKTKE